MFSDSAIGLAFRKHSVSPLGWNYFALSISFQLPNRPEGTCFTDGHNAVKRGGRGERENGRTGQRRYANAILFVSKRRGLEPHKTAVTRRYLPRFGEDS